MEMTPEQFNTLVTVLCILIGGLIGAIVGSSR